MLCFDVVKRQIVSSYQKLSENEDMLWSLDDVIKFFEIFYYYHNKHCIYPHPFLRNKTIEWIICNIAYDDSGNDYCIEDYMYMIPQYFKTKFHNCDYSIVHFMSGDIRLMRYYELGGGFVK